MKRMRIVVVALFCCVAVSTGWGQITLGAGVFATGGGMFSGATYAAAGTIGQGMIGRATGVSFAASAGFWGDGGIILGVEGPAVSDLPTTFVLHQNYPNPFNPNTIIRFAIPIRGTATVRVYDLLGREVLTLLDGVVEAGIHTLTLSGAGLASGTYVVRMAAGSFTQVRKILLIR